MIPTEEEKEKLPYSVLARKDSGSFVLRFTLIDREDPTQRTPQYRIGLKTKDEAEAYQLAAKEYERAALRHEEGLMVGPARFDKVSASYKNKLLKEAKAKGDKRKYKDALRAQLVIENYFDPQFGKLAIGAIRQNRIEDYKLWRKAYWTTGPGKDRVGETYDRKGEDVKFIPRNAETSDATIKREFNYLRGIFKHAVLKGYIKDSDIPKISMGKVESRRRPAFTQEEFAKLENKAIERYYDACKLEIETTDKQEYEKELAAKNRLIFERQQMVDFINIAVKTGMRPVELFNMKWGHVIGLASIPVDDFGDKDIRIYAEGKNKEGYVVPVTYTAQHFLSLAENYKERFGSHPTKDDRVFCDAYGKPITSLNKQLNQLLKAADLVYDISGKNKFSTYSFRHSYATWQLLNETNVGIYTLSINMRTSVEMIEKHYGHLKAEQKSKELRGQSLSGNTAKGFGSSANDKPTFGDWGEN